MICSACLKTYKSQSSLLSHQRSRCKTFLDRKPQKKHLNPDFKALLLHVNPNIADIIHQYIGSRKDNITSMITSFVETSAWFKQNVSFIPLISVHSTVRVLNQISTYLYRFYKNHMLLQEFNFNFAIQPNTNDSNIKTDFLSKLLILQNLMQCFGIAKKFKKYAISFHDVEKWCTVVLQDYDNLRWKKIK